MNTADIGLVNWFLQRALRTPERAALGLEGRSWSYAQMQQSIEQLAGRLHGLGVERGDRVAFLGLNQPMFLVALFASARLGAIFVPPNFRLVGPEVAANIGDADVSVLIADAQHRSVVDGVRNDLSSVRHFLSEDGAEGWEPVDDRRSVATDQVRVKCNRQGSETPTAPAVWDGRACCWRRSAMTSSSGTLRTCSASPGERRPLSAGGAR